MSKNVYIDILFRGNKYMKTISCNKCNSTDVKVREQQTRSSDEPVSIFIACKACGYVEIDMGD